MSKPVIGYFAALIISIYGLFFVIISSPFDILLKFIIIIGVIGIIIFFILSASPKFTFKNLKKQIKYILREIKNSEG